MALEWNVFGAMRMFACIAGVTLGVVVYAARPDRFQNRILALTLFVEGLQFFGPGLLLLTDDASVAYPAVRLWFYVFIALLGLYVVSLGTFDTPIAPIINSLPFRIVLGALLTGGWFLVVTQPEEFATGVAPVWFASYEVVFQSWTGHLSNISILVSTVSLTVTLWAWRRAPRGSLKRRTAGMVAAAFAVRDIVLLIFFVELWFRINFLPLGESRAWDTFHIVMHPLGFFTFYVLLAYGIVKHQIFDIDLKIKFAVKSSTLAGIFVASFFIVDQLVQALAGRFFGAVAGAIAAGLLLFFLQPLHRIATRVADVAMPNVQPTPEYVAFRKFEVYQAALESALEGGVTPKERRTLEALREKLGIKPTDAVALERDHASRAGAA